MITKNIFIVIIIITCFPAASSVSTIKVGDQLNLTSQLVSPRKKFTLGFFTIRETGNTYLGIWHTSDSSSTKLWVANRSNPIMSNSSVLMIDPDTGKLIIATGGRAIVYISDNQSGPMPNMTATLQETGDFQLKSGKDDRVLWKSFDHPTNVLIPGMKLGWDGRTGRNWELTSWLNDKYPDLGNFTMSFEANGENSERLMIRRQGKPYWNKPVNKWNGFGGGTFWYNLSYAYNSEERSFSYYDDNCINCPNMWILNANGQVVEGVVDDRYLWSPEFCYGYDSGNGCVAGSDVPSCRSRYDKYALLNGELFASAIMIIPNFSLNLTLSDCMETCWNDCNCLAFNSHENGTGCKIWRGTKPFKFRVNPRQISSPMYVLVSSGKGNGAKILIGVLVVSSIFLLLFCLGLLWYLKNRKRIREEGNRDKYKHLHELELKDSSDTEGGGVKESDMVMFSFDAIVTATDDFSDDNKLGQGGFGPVYKGKLSNEQEIAIKRLAKHSGQGLVEFKNELILIAELQHTNLVRVLGCCIHGEEKMLIYEYMPNKSLDFFLFDDAMKAQLDWPKRRNIIEGISQGLLYLHKYSRTRVIHRDLKASNVLLDESMNPKISDFGMARIFKQDETEAMSQRVVGTFGYMAPELAMGRTFSVKSDVFSYGVLILEIVSGRRNTCRSFRYTTINLIGYTWKLWQQEDPLQLQDATLADSCIASQLLRTIHVALLCVQENAVDRPEMFEVISMLNNETMLLPVPKRPAFIFANTVSTSPLVEGKAENVSVNNITMTQMEAR